MNLLKARSLIVLAMLLSLSGCVLRPAATSQESARLQQAGQPYEPPVEQRRPPEIPSPATWRDVLHRAFLANGDLEAAYFEWKAAVIRIDMASAWPNSNLQLGFDYMFSSERMKAWDRTTLSLGFDPSMPLSWPNKVRQAGKVALDAAQVAGDRFMIAKFDLQQRVLISYLDLALMEEKVRIQEDNVALLYMLADTAASRVQAGAPQQDLLKAQLEHRRAENELIAMKSQAAAMRAMLNGMLARPAQTPLKLPPSLPDPRPLTVDDSRLIAVAVNRNPELSRLAHEVAGRKDALEKARMAYIPDIAPSASITGNVSQMVGAMVMLPTNIPMIRASINEAGAMLRSAEAMARQTRSDRAAAFVAELYALRSAERQSLLIQQRIAPAAEQVMSSSRQAYSTGQVGFADLIDAQRMVLEVRQMAAEAKIEREKRLAALEALAGTDIETLGGKQP